MATYTTELEALNALCDKIDSLDAVMNTTNACLHNIQYMLESTNTKLDSEINLTTGLRGAVADVKNAPTDIKIEPLYVGDRADKRAKTEEKMAGLFADGYRIQNVLGLSEDLARVLFVKYPEPNDAAEGGGGDDDAPVWTVTSSTPSDLAYFSIDSSKFNEWYMDMINMGGMMSSPAPDGVNYEANIRFSTFFDPYSGDGTTLWIGSMEDGMDIHPSNMAWFNNVGINAELAPGVESTIVTIKRPILFT